METILFRHILTGTEIIDKQTLSVVAIAGTDDLPLDTQVQIIDEVYYVTN